MYRPAFILALLLLVMGCAVQYQYGDRTYMNPAEPLAVMRQEMRVALAAIRPEDQPIAGRVKIVLPDNRRLRQFGIRWGPGRRLPEIENYVVSGMEISFGAAADSVRKSNLFQSVEVFHEYDTEHPPIGDFDYLLWMHLAGPDAVQWYLTRAGKDGRLLVPMDTTLKLGAKARDWIQNVRKAIQELEGEVATRKPPRSAKRETVSQSKKISGGTGFIVGVGGQVLTNDHVIRTCDDVIIRQVGEGSRIARVVARDRRNDLALLLVDGKSKGVANFRSGRGVRMGEEIVTYGFPLPGALASSGNLTTGSLSALAGLGDDTRFLQITAPIQQGNSGGALLDASGNVVGIVTSKLNALKVAGITGDVPQNVNFAIKASLVRNFLEANGIEYVTTQSEKALPVVKIGERARSFTVQVLCEG